MRALTVGVLALLASGFPAAADAQSSSRLAIGSIRGESAAVRRQILLQICGPYQCVAASRYTTDDRPDPEKLAAGGVTGYLGGAVTGTKADRRVILTLTTPTTSARKPAKTWRLRLSPDGRLRPQVLERFTIEVDELLQASAAQLPPAPAAPPQRAAPKAPPPQPPPAARPPPARAPPPAARPPPRPPPEEDEDRPRRQPREREIERAPDSGEVRFAAEAGFWVTGRKLTYSGASGNLRTFDASAVFVPSLRLEAYAAAFGVHDRFLSGLGLHLDYGHSVALKVKPPEGDAEGDRDGTLTALDAGVIWRVHPMAGSRLALAPALSYRSLQVTTSPEIAGLPDTRLSGVEVRLDVDAPVGDSFRLVGGAGYTLWTQAKDLVKGDGFFGKGSARGLALEGGLLYHVMGPLQVRAMVTYQRTTYSGLGEPATNDLAASGATESYFGGRVMARGEF